MDVQGIDATVPAAGGRTLALTFDACGGPGGYRIDTGLVDVLRRNHVPATNGDSGATFTAAQVTSALTHAASGVVVMHMNQPGRGTMPGVAAALPTLKAAGTTFVHLS